MKKKFVLKRFSCKGFSMIELLVVVGILALLIIAGIWAYQRQLAKGWDARRKADLAKIKIALEEYEKDHDCYPLICTEGQTQGCYPSNCSETDTLKPYINQVPCDPRLKTPYEYLLEGVTCPHLFKLYSTLDNRKDTIMTKINCTNNCGPNCAFQYYVASTNTYDTSNCTPSSSGGGGTGTTSPASTQPPGAFYWGCINGECVNLAWDSQMNKPVCGPNYPSEWSCNSNCEPGMTSCIPIR